MASLIPNLPSRERFDQGIALLTNVLALHQTSRDQKFPKIADALATTFAVGVGELLDNSGPAATVAMSFNKPEPQ